MGPTSQGPEVKVKPLPRYVPDAAPAPAAPPPEPEKPKEKGILSNLPTASDTLDDIVDFAKGLVQIFPDMAKLGIEAVKNPAQYGKDLKKVFTTKAGTEAMKEFGFGFVPFSQVIREGPGILKTKPFSAGVVEVVAALPLLGGMLKATGTVAKASGVGAKAEKLIRIGRYLETLPANAARAAIDKAVGKGAKMMGGEWNLPKRREFLDIKAESTAANAVAKDHIGKQYQEALGSLSKVEKEQFYKAARVGVPAAELPTTSPKVLKALDLNDRVTAHMAQEYGNRAMMTQGRAEGALAKKYAIEMGWNINDPKAVAQAARDIRALRAAGGRGPSYLPHVPVKGAWKANAGDVVNDLMTGGRVVRTGKVGALEALTGAAKYERDPAKVVARMLDDHYRTLNKMHLAERVRENAALSKGTSSAFEGQQFEGVFKKYFDDDIRAQANKHITDPTIKTLLKWEFTQNKSKLIKAYDVLQGWFTKQATRWNPRFHIGNVYTNAILMTLFGGDPILGAKLKAAMPSRAIARSGGMSAADMGKLPGKLETFKDIAGGADAMARTGMISARTAQDLSRMGYSFEQAAKALPDVLRSTDDFNRLQIELTLLRDAVARRSPIVGAYDESIATLRAKEARLSEALGNFEAIEKTAPTSKVAQTIVDDLPIAGQKPGMPGPRLFKTKAQKQGLEEIKNLRQQIVNMEVQRQAVIGDLTSKTLRIAEREGRIPELKPMVDIVRANVTYANAFTGEYLGLDGFEQGVLRRLVPFYAWTKAMTMLSFRLPFIAPVKSFMWHRFAETLQTIAQDPDMPPRLKGFIPVGVMKDGRTVWVNAGSYSPFGSLRNSRIGEVPVPGLMNVVEKNPLLSLMFSFHGGKTLWNVGNIPYGEQVVMVGDGTVARFGKDGLLHEEIPQTPLVSGMVNYFPITQYLKGVLQPYWTNKFNWAGVPQPILNSDGTYRFPREGIERLGALVGIPITARTKEDFKKQEQMRVMKVIKNLSPAYKKGDDEEKATIRQYIEDYRKGDYRHFEER